MSYKHYLNNHFSGCRLLAQAQDLHRKRRVQVFSIPGEFEIVGVFDGVDAWVAPVAANPFDCNIIQIIQQLRDGKNPAVFITKEAAETGQNGPTKRRKLATALPTAPDLFQAPATTRRRLNART